MVPNRSTQPVAEILRPLLEQLLRGPSPLKIRMWDGSELGPDSRTTLIIHSPVALQRLMWAPGELGLARAYVAGDLQLDGNVFDLLEI